jgi:plastocyanin
MDHMFRRHVLTLPALVASALALAACGGGSASEPKSTLPAGAVIVDGIDGNRFDAADYSAAAGDVTISFTNKSSVNHTLLVLDSSSQQIGLTLKVAAGSGNDDVGAFPLKAGTYTLFCNIAGHENMKASLTVK